MPNNPRDYAEARLLRASEPYHYQRQRSSTHSNYPRTAQPNISQPNQRSLEGWGMTTREYWDNVFSDYLRRRRSAASLTNLALGGK